MYIVLYSLQSTSIYVISPYTTASLIPVWQTREKSLKVPPWGKSRAQICCKSQHISTTYRSMDVSTGFGIMSCLLFHVLTVWRFFMPSVLRCPQDAPFSTKRDAPFFITKQVRWGGRFSCSSLLGQGDPWSGESQEKPSLLAQMPRLRNAAVLGQAGTSIYHQQLKQVPWLASQKEACGSH